MNWIYRVPLERIDPIFSSELTFEVGAVVKFDDGTRLLIGHANGVGGICNHCRSEHLDGCGPKVVALGHVENMNRKETIDGELP